ncbi:S8 family serine peptidase [Ramlibacter albus]|uniref:S8 family serine peptidase n=1 Tax=Ramlibacter albus TaxID=2079448 RepID=A0A923M7W4_9BURK|nr:S8 family serine peptidase [Ramlibacter albus]MBC5764339.1 S8 family serine peptidase [Ramlibacter albus]
MKARVALVALCAALVAGSALAQQQPLKRVERADDLPRFTYTVQGELEAIVRDPQKFAAFAAPLKRDIEGVLATHDIAEKATQRSLLGLLGLLAMLENRYDDALKLSEQVRALQERPADKLLSGMTTRAIVAAQRKTGTTQGPAYAVEVARLVREELDKLPYATIRNEIQQAKAGVETASETGALGRVREVVQPVVTRSGSLSSDLAPALVGARYALVYALPLKAALTEAYAAYLAANRQDKPDIWAARDVALPPGRDFKPVTVVVWDSGVDTNIFADRLLRQGDKPALLAFDVRQRPSTEPLLVFPAALKERLPVLQARSKGFSDLVSNVDSKEAAEVKALLSNLAPDQYKQTVEEIRLNGNYQHGTHVAGIAMAGNPYARLAIARIEFQHTLRPDPCPSEELELQSERNLRAYGDFIRSTGARVVNMSWGGNPRAYEVALEQCGMGKDVAERRALARRWFEAKRKTLTEVMASLPDVLFVASAGNSANDPTFNDSYPSGIELPNLVVVGAVDKAGDEASFTSYGRTVVLHANGYQVESYVPGGSRLSISGTSMSAPQVTNLAAKILAVKPGLKPKDVVDVMRATAERSDDGRRTLVHPAKALAAVGYTGGR